MGVSMTAAVCNSSINPALRSSSMLEPCHTAGHVGVVLFAELLQALVR